MTLLVLGYILQHSYRLLDYGALLIVLQHIMIADPIAPIVEMRKFGTGIAEIEQYDLDFLAIVLVSDL